MNSVSEPWCFLGQRNYSFFVCWHSYTDTSVSCVQKSNNYYTLTTGRCIIKVFTPAQTTRDWLYTILQPTEGYACVYVCVSCPSGEYHHMRSALKCYCVLRGCKRLSCRLKSQSHVVSLFLLLLVGFQYSACVYACAHKPHGTPLTCLLSPEYTSTHRRTKTNKWI